MTIRRITNNKYHSLSELGSSSIVDIYTKSVWHWRNKIATETPAMIFGSAYHKKLLEPDLFENEYCERGKQVTLPKLISPVMCLPDGIKQRRGKKFDAFRAENPIGTILTQTEWDWYQLKQNGKQPLSADAMQTLEGMQCAWALPQHNEAADILWGWDAMRNGLDPPHKEFELSFFFKYHGVAAKCRPDVWYPDGRKIYDLKTTINASPDEFRRTVLYRRHYDIQAAWYTAGVENVTGVKHKFVWIAQEKTYPFGVGIYTAGDGIIESGRRKINIALEKLKTNENGTDVGYPSLEFN